MHPLVTSTPELSDCEYSLHDVPDSSPQVILEYYGALRKYVEHEDELINSRLTWSLTIHGFLFTGFALLLSKAADVLIELSKPHGAPQTLLIASVFVLLSLQAVIAFVGAVLSHTANGAIKAAHNAIQHVSAIAQQSLLKPAAPGRRVDNAMMLLPKILGGGSGKPEFIAAAQAYYTGVPFFLMVVWIVLGTAAFALAIASVIVLPSVVSQSPKPAVTTSFQATAQPPSRPR
jgi:hypothetical protein